MAMEDVQRWGRAGRVLPEHVGALKIRIVRFEIRPNYRTARVVFSIAFFVFRKQRQRKDIRTSFLPFDRTRLGEEKRARAEN